MRPSANNQGRRWDEISCCLESNPLVSDKNLPESKQDKIIVVSSHGKKQKQNKTKKNQWDWRVRLKNKERKGEENLGFHRNHPWRDLEI